MLSKNKDKYQRPQAKALLQRLLESRNFIQIIAGPRQVGKTTLINQVAEQLDCPVRYVSADEPSIKGPEWVEQQWEIARLECAAEDQNGSILVIDEIQKIPNWSETVKRLWDADSKSGTGLKVVLLGSAPLLIKKGLTESLTGRFEITHLPHWSYSEMNQAFGLSVDEYIFFGAYPGAVGLISDFKRWSDYIRNSLIETTISRDILLITRVDKPALMRKLFDLGCIYSSQILSYTKMLGQLHDAGNTTTLSHYLELLSGAGMITGLQKYSKGDLQRRGSSPKLQVLNTALMTAQVGLNLDEAQAERDYWGRLVESAIGAHLVNATRSGSLELYYWRDKNREVDFVLKQNKKVVAIEVKSGRRRDSLRGMSAFSNAFQTTRKLLVGGDGIPVEEFLAKPVDDWLK
jgi:uncharacterized protein